MSAKKISLANCGTSEKFAESLTTFVNGKSCASVNAALFAKTFPTIKVSLSDPTKALVNGFAIPRRSLSCPTKASDKIFVTCNAS